MSRWAGSPWPRYFASSSIPDLELISTSSRINYYFKIYEGIVCEESSTGQASRSRDQLSFRVETFLVTFIFPFSVVYSLQNSYSHKLELP